jgi:hypothetical protein
MTAFKLLRNNEQVVSAACLFLQQHRQLRVLTMLPVVGLCGHVLASVYICPTVLCPI